MGPYCKFCGQRCFVHFPKETPAHILSAYGTSAIIATCPGGQEFEKQRVGYCYDDIQALIQTGRDADGGAGTMTLKNARKVAVAKALDLGDVDEVICIYRARPRQFRIEVGQSPGTPHLVEMVHIQWVHNGHYKKYDPRYKVIFEELEQRSKS